jgi:serine/threonine protein kinase
MASGSLPKYTLVRCIAHSTSGDVFLGEDDSTGEEVAIHVIDLEKIDSEDLTSGSRRIVLHSQCNTPLMKSFVGSYVIPNTSKLCIVSEYLEYSAKQILQVHSAPLSECAISEVLAVVLRCLKYLHKKGIAHNDIRAENILLDKTGAVVKLNSFSTFVNLQASHSAIVPYWSAPEVVLGKGGGSTAPTSSSSSKAADDINDDDDGGGDRREVEGRATTSQDIWSVGMTALELAGHLPFKGMDRAKAVFLLKEGGKVPLPSTAKISKTFHDFVSLCLSRDPSSRPTAKELLKHKFIKAKASKGPRLQDYTRELRKQKRLIALTPRFGTVPEESNNAAKEDTQWEFGKKSSEENLVLSMLDRISKQMAKVLRDKSLATAPAAATDANNNAEEEEGEGDETSSESLSSLGESLEQSLARVKEIYSLFSPVEQKQVEDSFSLFLEKHATIRLTSEAFRTPGSLRNSIDVNAYMRLGLFSRFVIKRWKDNVNKNKVT